MDRADTSPTEVHPSLGGDGHPLGYQPHGRTGSCAALSIFSATAACGRDCGSAERWARSNVSTSLKELQGWGIVKMVHVMGDKRDHFESMKDVWGNVSAWCWTSAKTAGNRSHVDHAPRVHHGDRRRRSEKVIRTRKNAVPGGLHVIFLKRRRHGVLTQIHRLAGERVAKVHQARGQGVEIVEISDKNL